MKASDISDERMLRTIADIAAQKQHARTSSHTPWVFTWDIAPQYPDIPWKVILAKLRRLKHRGLIDGCDCGCRGDWELTPQGRVRLGEPT